MRLIKGDKYPPAMKEFINEIIKCINHFVIEEDEREPHE